MAYRIVCTEQDTPTYHHHIKGVGTGDFPGFPNLRWSVAEVRQWIASGVRFYTVSPSTRRVANVEPFECACGRQTIRSTPDAIHDNNLDSLPICRS